MAGTETADFDRVTQLSQCSLCESRAAAGTETCNEIGHRVKLRTPSRTMADQRRGAVHVKLTFKLPVWIMWGHQKETR